MAAISAAFLFSSLPLIWQVWVLLSVVYVPRQKVRFLKRQVEHKSIVEFQGDYLFIVSLQINFAEVVKCIFRVGGEPRSPL